MRKQGRKGRKDITPRMKEIDFQTINLAATFLPTGATVHAIRRCSTALHHVPLIGSCLYASQYAPLCPFPFAGVYRPDIV
jgi:hypothetical protein